MSDLRNLIETVDAGKAKFGDFSKVFPSESAYWKCTWHDADKAYSGSLNAAWAMQKALLPGHPAIVETDGNAQVSWGVGVGIWPELSEAEVPGSPARAWLIAILKAYEATHA